MRHIFKSKCIKHPFPDHLWKLRCRKNARHCGAMFGPLLKVEMFKKCTPLWHEAHFQVKTYKAHHSQTTFGSCNVEKVHAIVARRTFRGKNVQNAPAWDHFLVFRCRKSVRRCGAKHTSKSKVSKTLGLGPLLDGQMLFYVVLPGMRKGFCTL